MTSRDVARVAWVSACGLSITAGLTAGGILRAENPAASTSAGDMICGPRSMEYVLFWYRKDEDVSDLIWELQGGDVGRPVSLMTLGEALAKRQIYTKAVEVSPGAELQWPYPAILHMNQTPGPGHYVVRVPPGDGRPTLFWSGSTGYVAEVREDKFQRLSGVVLLTSPTPIEDTPPVTEGGWSVTAWIAGAAASLAGFVGVVTRLGRRRSAGRVT